MGEMADYYDSRCLDDSEGVVCRHCDQDGLEWEFVGRWVLIEQDGRRHKCPAKGGGNG